MSGAPLMSFREGETIPRIRDERRSGEETVQAWWLGQAGFLLQTKEVRVLVDPYLSDALAKKYAGKPLPHIRMAPAPVAAAALRDVDAVFSTHGHSDHLDPEALGIIARNNPHCRFIVPFAERRTAVDRGIPEDRLLPMDAAQTISFKGLSVEALPSAHETLRYDQDGHSLFLGFLFDFGVLRLYHSGDCVPYPGLVEALAERLIDIALLPVNGRDKERTDQGIVGNFSLQEAVDLVLDSGIGLGIGHHFGLFDFNTIDPLLAQKYLDNRTDAAGRFVLVRSGGRFDLRSSSSLTSPRGGNRIGP